MIFQDSWYKLGLPLESFLVDNSIKNRTTLSVCRVYGPVLPSDLFASSGKRRRSRVGEWGSEI